MALRQNAELVVRSRTIIPPTGQVVPILWIGGDGSFGILVESVSFTWEGTASGNGVLTEVTSFGEHEPTANAIDANLVGSLPVGWQGIFSVIKSRKEKQDASCD